MNPSSPSSPRDVAKSVVTCAAQQHEKWLRSESTPCGFIFENQKANEGRFFFPEPFIGNPRAPVAFIGINPQLDDQCTIYDPARINEFLDHTCRYHLTWTPRKRTGKWMNKMSAYLNEALGYGPRSFAEGGAIKMNAAACRSTKWNSSKGTACIRLCRMNLDAVMRLCKPLIMIAAGKDAFKWLKDQAIDESGRFGPMDRLSGGFQDNLEKKCIVSVGNLSVVALITPPGMYWWLKEYVLDEVARVASTIRQARVSKA